jgi:hypothetical protein
MAICAHELALRDLGEDAGPAPAMNHRAHVFELALTGEMIPLHRSVVKHTAAIGARPVVLQGTEPLDLFARSFFRLDEPQRPSPCVIRRVVRPPARLAPRLHAAATLVEFP